MSWTDKASIEHIKKIRDIFKIKTLVETGSYNGNNARCYSRYFQSIFTCELNPNSYLHAREKLKDYKNVAILNEHSPKFLKRFATSEMPKIFYLDAHFYNVNLPEEKRFVVLEELEALKGNKNCIIIVHDFHNGLGGITYDGIDLDLKLLKPGLKKINKNFKFYTNQLESCDPKKLEEAEDLDELDNLKFAWSKPEKTYRGLLYCVPEEINIDGLKEIK